MRVLEQGRPIERTRRQWAGEGDRGMPPIDWMKWVVWLFYNAVIPLAPVVIVKFISWVLSNAKSNPPKRTLQLFSIIKGRAGVLLLHGLDLGSYR
jgi:hypothetical protein